MCSGNVKNFVDWEVDFDAYVADEDLTHREALRHLKKFVTGDAKKSITGLLSVSTAESYIETRKKLKDGFSVPEYFERNLTTGQSPNKVMEENYENLVIT